MTFEIRQVDPADEEAFRAFYDIYVACGRNDQRSFVASPYAELAAVIREPTEDFAFTAFLAYEDGEPVGEGWYAGFLRANVDQASVTPRVLPAYRRRGIGTQLLHHLEQFAAADGRRLLMSVPRWGMAAGPDGAGAANVEFARKHGYPLVLVEAKRRLRLPVGTELLDRLDAAVDPAYRIEAFAGPIPERWVQAWAELEASLPTEAPTGDMEVEEYPASVASVRSDERIHDASGRTRYAALAFAANGDPVGYTDIVVGADGEPAEQGGTLVRRAHRGHGLGHGLKAAVLRLLQTERPEVAATVTSNALSNAAMVAVNDRLGYEVVDYLGDVQKRLS